MPKKKIDVSASNRAKKHTRMIDVAGEKPPTTGTTTPTSAPEGPFATPPTLSNTETVWDKYQSTRTTDPNLCVRHGGNNFRTQQCPECRTEWGALTQANPPSQWGAVLEMKEVAPGVLDASCVGHGGIKLSPERQKAIPPSLRKSWYEEDLDTSIVAMYHPDAFPELAFSVEDLDRVRRDGARQVMDWYPDEYEKATGERIPFGASHIRDRQEWEKKFGNQPVVASFHASEHPDLPGYVLVKTKPSSTSDTVRMHVIPVEEYGNGRDVSFGAYVTPPKIVPESAIDVTLPPAAEPQQPPVTSYSIDRLTASQRARLDADLDKPWRHAHSHDVFTLRQQIAEGRFVSKRSFPSADRGKYTLCTTDGYVVNVTKAVFDAYDGPDETTEVARIRGRITSLTHSRHRARDGKELNRVKEKIAVQEALLEDALERESKETRYLAARAEETHKQRELAQVEYAKQRIFESRR